MATGSSQSEPSETSPEWTTYSGKYAYSAYGTVDVLLIVSVSPSGNPDIVSRRSRGELTDDERRKLEHQGVPTDCQLDDLSIMKARYSLDKDFNIVQVEISDTGRELTCEDVKKQIASLMNNTDKAAVIIHYIGHGKKNTGDWCFSDGFITLREILDIYMNNQHFRGRVLSIISDCSYSGSWVKECMQFMDEQEVGPCGHAAKEKGTLLQVITSCLSNEISTELNFAVHTCRNDKNTKTISTNCNLRSAAVGEGQHPSGIDFNAIRCGNKKIDDPCTMAAGSTWKKWSAGERVWLVVSNDNVLPIWYFIRLVDDDETICSLMDKKFNENPKNYGQILKIGYGDKPPNEVTEWIDKNYKVDYKYEPH